MKQSITLPLKEVSRTDLNKLVIQVKETLDIPCPKTPCKVFNQVSLWSVYRQRRNFSSRRFM